MKTYELPAATLRAALECAPKGDVRYYLNGVLIDAPKGRVVSTTGSILFVGAAPEDRAFRPIILPRDTIELSMKALGRKSIERTAVCINNDDGVFSLATLAGTFGFLPVDGQFPEYERVIPDRMSKEVAQFDPELLLDARNALQWYSGQKRNCGHLTHNGNGPACYSEQGIDAMCIVMPYRAGEPSDNAWYWRNTKAKAA